MILRKRFQPMSGIVVAAALLVSPAGAQSLTTIQDTLFKADGARFSGTLTIQWSTFDATNIGTIVQQSKTVDVGNGNLMVQLAPNAGVPAPANVYTVHYQSDGSQQFTETWTVPSSSTPLTVAAVRIGTVTSGAGAQGTSAGSSTPIAESAVTGLVSDLAQRPIKGPGFGTGSVAVINQNGQIETAIGDIGECVYIDGTAGPCGSPQSQFFDAETPGGIADGMNDTFTLLNPPSGSSLTLFRNGIYMKAGFDYNLNISSIQFVPGAIPQPGDTLVASYRIDPNAGNLGALTSNSTNGTPVALAQVLCSSSGKANVTNTWASLGACDIPANALNPGDRIEVRFSFTHDGSGSGFDTMIDWGTTTILARSGGTQDAAFTGQAEAAITSSGAQISIQSWGSVLTFLPGIVSSGPQTGLKLDIQGRISTPGSDTLTLTNYTVLRYPGH
ncbi:MAG: hypothetical protein KGN84_06330 [Acidobacteriota bacterium]|nr:hypothetical protein [Acidobacteriota bacterium]